MKRQLGGWHSANTLAETPDWLCQCVCTMPTSPLPHCPVLGHAQAGQGPQATQRLGTQLAVQARAQTKTRSRDSPWSGGAMAVVQVSAQAWKTLFQSCFEAFKPRAARILPRA